MTRKALVKQKAQKLASRDEFSPTLTECFIAGVESENKRLVENACEWLDSIDFDMKYWNPEDGVCVGDFIEDLRKVMEE